MKCAVRADIDRFDLVQQQEQNRELETEKVADELVDLTVAELLYRIDTANRDSDRPQAARKRLRDIYEEVDGLIVEAATYRI